MGRHGFTDTRARGMLGVAPLAAALCLLVAAGASARPEPGPPPHARPDGRPFPPRRNEEMRRSIGLFFVHRARIALSLTDDQALKLLPLVEKVEELRRDSEMRRREVTRKLEQAAGDPATQNDDVTRLIQSLDKEDGRLRTEQDQVRGEMLALLTPQQKARFVLFAHRIRGAIDEQVRNMQQNRPRDRMPDRGGPPPDREPGPGDEGPDSGLRPEQR